jgi:hypothetical protein
LPSCAAVSSSNFSTSPDWRVDAPCRGPSSRRFDRGRA